MHYEYAPIEEALLDIRVELPEGYSAGDLLDIGEIISDAYPQIGEMRTFHQEFKAEEDGHINIGEQDEALRGMIAKSEDGKRIAQFRIDGFTHNRLKPYSTWEEMFDDAIGLWALYVRQTAPEAITRIAVRYINKFNAPASDLRAASKYLSMPPTIPNSLPPRVMSSMARFVAHDGESGVSCNLSQSVNLVEDREELEIVIDIDAYIVERITADVDELTMRFGVLREQKNNVFESCITDFSRELFR